MKHNNVSARAAIITRRTYNRPLNDEGTVFETWEQTVDRVINHQRWLWERALKRHLNYVEHTELDALRKLMLDRKVSVSGRTLWLGGTEVSRKRESSMFNCSFGQVQTIHDVVDALWLLLQGCGVGFEPVVGILNGFSAPVEIEVVRSTRKDRGVEKNITVFSPDKKEWRLIVGDSAEAWAKAAGKLLAMKVPVERIILDFSQIRPAGERLKGYGWISSGDEQIAIAFKAIAQILNKRAGQLLTQMDILDVMNWLGTVLSSRRSAEIVVMRMDSTEIDDFIVAKKDWWLHNNGHRQQSNNSILFYNKPSKWELYHVMQKMQEAGGSEPGFINAEAALKRAPWFKGVNPCAEILLGHHSFCNLVEIDLGKFNDDFDGLLDAYRLAARANYRQTCVNLDDGILQRSWHELNEFLRLCGVGATGIVRWALHNSPRHWFKLKEAAKRGADSMADELGLPRAKLVTTVKPSGTLGKIMDTTEGVHKPLGKYIFNNVKFSKHDPLVPILRDANYHVFTVEGQDDAVFVRLPASYEDVAFDVVDGVEVNTESAVLQLDRYKTLMDYYVDHNCSVTISYDPSEVPEIVEWLYANWDTYVGVSFIYRNDPTKTAADLGYKYLPQEVVTKETFDSYTKTLLPIDLDKGNTFEELEQDGCATGACPIR